MSAENLVHSMAKIVRRVPYPYPASDRQAWELLETQSSRFEKEDEFDSLHAEEARGEIEAAQTKIEQARKRVSTALTVFSVAFLAAVFLSLVAVFNGNAEATLPVATVAFVSVSLLLSLFIGLVILGFQLLLLKGVSSMFAQSVLRAFKPNDSPRQLYLNQGAVRFAIGDSGLLVDGCSVEARYCWRSFRCYELPGEQRPNGTRPENASHIVLILERDLRHEIIVIPYKKFFSKRTEWRTFVDFLNTHVEKCAERQFSGSTDEDKGRWRLGLRWAPAIENNAS